MFAQLAPQTNMREAAGADNNAQIEHHELEARFERIKGGFPWLQSSEVKQKLVQWNLNETLQIHRFRVKQKITPENEVVLIQSLFQDDHVQQTLSLPATKQPIEVTCKQLRLSVMSMAFFDSLVEAGVVTKEGSLRRCMDEIYDGSTVSDQLKDLFVNPDSACTIENAFPPDTKQQELLFHLMRVLVTGGALNQSDDHFAPYEELARSLYRALVSVKKNSVDPSAIDVTSRAFVVHHKELFRSQSRFCACLVVLDPKKRWVTILHQTFVPFW